MKKNDVIASEINDENDTNSMLKLKILSAIKFIWSKKEYMWSVNENELI